MYTVYADKYVYVYTYADSPAFMPGYAIIYPRGP